MAAISFIDEDCEIFKAEHAFNRKYVGRSESIGAHVLLSNEPVVILDTEKVRYTIVRFRPKLIIWIRTGA